MIVNAILIFAVLALVIAFAVKKLKEKKSQEEEVDVI